MNASKFGISASTVREEVRISLTHQLLSLRDEEDVREIIFPSSLSNIERKFVHKIAGKWEKRLRSFTMETALRFCF